MNISDSSMNYSKEEKNQPKIRKQNYNFHIQEKIINNKVLSTCTRNKTNAIDAPSTLRPT